MGLRRGKVQSTYAGLYILPRADDKEKCQRIKRKDACKKVEKYLSRSTTYLIMDSGAHVMRKEEKNH
jgi:MinD-like ATPase involved in chromosome partitioning or flagellar assembly